MEKKNQKQLSKLETMKARCKPTEEVDDNEKLPEDLKIKIQQFPPVVAELHPFQKYYADRVSNRKAKTDIQKVEYEVSLKTIQAFRNKTALSATQKSLKFKSKPAHVDAKDMRTINSYPKDVDGELIAGGLYIVQIHEGVYIRLVPLFREIVATDRVDLALISMSTFAINNLDGKSYQLNAFKPGDVLLVTDLERRPDINFFNAAERFQVQNFMDPKSHNFWLVKNYYLVSRTIDTNVLAVPIQSSREQFDFCAVGHNEVVVAATGRGQESTIREDQWYQIDVMRVKVLPGKFTGDLKRVYEGMIRRSTEELVPFAQFASAAIRVAELPEPDMEPYRKTPYIFNDLNQMSPNTWSIFMKAMELGAAAVHATQNQSIDRVTHHVQVLTQEDTLNGRIYTVNLGNKSGRPRFEHWARAESFRVATSQKEVFHAELIKAEYQEYAIKISFRITNSKEPALLGRTIYVSMIKPVQGIGQLKRLENFVMPDRDSAAFINLTTVFAAEHTSTKVDNFVQNCRKTPIRSSTGKMLDEGQSQLVHSIKDRSASLVIGAAPPGSGKTTVIAAAVSQLSRTVVTAISNAAVAAVLEAIRREDPNVRAVRMITEDNREMIPIHHRTRFDYWTLMKKVFIDKVREADKTRQFSITAKDAAYYVFSKGWMKEEDVESQTLKDSMKKNYRSKNSITTTFCQIYQPKVIVGTISSVLDFFTRDWKSQANSVPTVIIDEASQLPNYLYVDLQLIFRNASVTFIGDARQLPPYSDAFFPTSLKKIAIGDILRILEKRVPTLEMLRCYRCQADSTKIFSHLFYKSSLIAAPNFSPHIGISGSFGIPTPTVANIWVEHHGTETGVQFGGHYNNGEADLVERMVRAGIARHPNITVGILSFYSAQAKLMRTRIQSNQVECLTIDSSQGAEFDVVFILTTRSAPFEKCDFLRDERRINVALSRSKQMTVVMANTEGKDRGLLWDRVRRTSSGTTSRKLPGFIIMFLFSFFCHHPNPDTSRKTGKDQEKQSESTYSEIMQSEHGVKEPPCHIMPTHRSRRQVLCSTETSTLPMLTFGSSRTTVIEAPPTQVRKHRQGAKSATSPLIIGFDLPAHFFFQFY